MQADSSSTSEDGKTNVQKYQMAEIWRILVGKRVGRGGGILRGMAGNANQ